MVSRLQRKCVTNGPNARRRGVRSLTEQSLQARPGAKDCRLQGRWKRLLHRITMAPRPKCSTCVPHVCESNRMTHRITSTRQSTNPSRTGIHETTICRTELDPYQPAKALVQTFDMIARSLTLPLAFPGGNPSTKLLASNAMSRSSIEI